MSKLRRQSVMPVLQLRGRDLPGVPRRHCPLSPRGAEHRWWTDTVPQRLRPGQICHAAFGRLLPGWHDDQTPTDLAEQPHGDT